MSTRKLMNYCEFRHLSLPVLLLACRQHISVRMWKYNQRPETGSSRSGRGKSARRQFNRKKENPDAGDTVILYGLHTVVQALGNAERKPLRLLATENAARRLPEMPAGLPIEPTIATASTISRITGHEAVHQGLLLEARPLPSPDLQSVMERSGPIVVLDQITDPHNVGAVLRSCAAFAAAGIVMTARHSPAESSVLAKSASGALEHVPISRVTNLSKAIEQLKASRIACIGLDSEAEHELESFASPQTRIALVFGAEGRGLRHKTRETCSCLARIDMPGTIKSLNVSNAAALALYVVGRP